MNALRKIKVWVAAFAVAAAFFGVSASYKQRRTDPSVFLPTGDLQLSGLAPVFAASSSWDGVRGVTTFINDVTRGVDRIIVGLQNSGALSQSSILRTTSGNLKIKLNPNFSSSVTSTALGARSYNVSFEAWRNDGVKFLELYFDSATARNEALVIWQPNVVDATVNPAGSNKIECAMSGGASNGFMVCSWNGPIENPGAVTAGRFKVDPNSVSGLVSVKGAAIAIANPCAGGNADVYAMAFIARNANPFYTTARFGFNDNAIAATVCGGANPLNNAYFNINANGFASDSSRYFVQEGVTTDLDPNYPTVASVNALFGELGGAADGDGVSITTAVLSALNVVFRGAASPDF
ncbi:MAG: hypothetical protein K1X75_17390 [Leptospirales bacterium]|nr:hypothetical protein [Leptospirales bacterium]